MLYQIWALLMTLSPYRAEALDKIMAVAQKKRLLFQKLEAPKARAKKD